MMNKLGFAIKVISTGAREPRSWNSGRWVSKVEDVREYLKLFDGLSGTDNSVTFLSFDEGGCFVTILQAITGRENDCNSGWIYIPSDLDIPVDDLMKAYEYVKDVILKKSNISDIESDIDNLFNREYDLKTVSAKYKPSQGNAFAIRYLGLYTMKEILNDRYQSSYADYKAIFLIDKEKGVKIRDNNIHDLTLDELVKQIVLDPPSQEFLQGCGIGTKMFFADNGLEFKNPIFVDVGEKKTVILKRSEFENIKRDIIVKENKIPLNPDDIKRSWQKKILPSLFFIRDERGNKIIDGITIEVEGQKVEPQGFLLSEERCRNAEVKITRNGYKPDIGQRDLLRQQTITLKQEETPFKSNVIMKNGEVAHLTIVSKYLPSDYNSESPLKGYHYDYKKNVLKLDRGFVWKQWLSGFLVAIGLICISAIVNWFGHNKLCWGWPPYESKEEIEGVAQTENPVETQEEKEIAAEEPAAEEAATTTVTAEDEIIKYMNNNSQWYRDELEKYELTEGLYDKINGYKFSEMTSVKINGCSQFDDIKKLSDEMVKNNIIVQGTYSQDGSITISKWINNVNNKAQQRRNNKVKQGGESVASSSATSTTETNEKKDGNEQNGGL